MLLPIFGKHAARPHPANYFIPVQKSYIYELVRNSSYDMVDPTLDTHRALNNLADKINEAQMGNKYREQRSNVAHALIDLAKCIPENEQKRQDADHFMVPAEIWETLRKGVRTMDIVARHYFKSAGNKSNASYVAGCDIEGFSSKLKEVMGRLSERKYFPETGRRTNGFNAS